MKYFAIYLILMNLIAFTVMETDKSRAKRRLSRVPEAVLLTLSFVGGSAGALLGMYAFRHKTRHRKFTVLLPLFFILHIATAVLIIKQAWF